MSCMPTNQVQPPDASVFTAASSLSFSLRYSLGCAAPQKDLD